MDWNLHADGEVNGAIARFEEDEAIQVRAAEDFALVEMRANAAAAKAHAGAAACRARAVFDQEEIARLRQEQA